MCPSYRKLCFGILVRFSILVIFEFVLTQLLQADGFKTLDHPCPAFSNVDFAGGNQGLGKYTEENYGGGAYSGRAYFERGYGYAS